MDRELLLRSRISITWCPPQEIRTRPLLLHQEAYRDPEQSQLHPETILARVVAKHFLLSSVFTEMRLEHGFSLAAWDPILERVTGCVAKELDSLDLATCDRDEFAEQHHDFG